MHLVLGMNIQPIYGRIILYKLPHINFTIDFIFNLYTSSFPDQRLSQAEITSNRTGAGFVI